MADFKSIYIILDVDNKFYQKAEYVFETFCRNLGLKPFFLYDCSIDVTKFEKNEFDIQNKNDNIGFIYYGSNLDKNYFISIYHNPESVVFFENKKLFPDDKIDFCKYRIVKTVG